MSKSSWLEGAWWMVSRVVWRVVWRAVSWVIWWGIPSLLLGILVTWHENGTIRVGIITVGIAAIFDSISWRYPHYIAKPVRHWLEDRQYATLLQGEGFSFAQIVKAIWIERIASEVMMGTRLVSIGANGEREVPRLTRLPLLNNRGPILRMALVDGKTLRDFQDELAALEAVFGCRIEVSKVSEHFIDLAFCLRDPVDPLGVNSAVLETNVLRSELLKCVESSRRLLFHIRLPLLLASKMREATDE